MFALGALVAGCASRPTSAPVVDRMPSSTTAPKPPVAQVAPVPGATTDTYYTVKRGDTLYSIALDHGADPRDVREWNRLESADRLQPGQVLRVTPPDKQPAPAVQVGAARGAGGADARPIESRPLDSRTPESRALDTRGVPVRPADAKPAPGASVAAMKSEPKAVKLPYSSENLAMLQRPEQAPAQGAPTPAPAAAPIARVDPKPAAASTAPPASEPREGDAIEFIWPARGKILTGFSEPTSKGVDIAGKAGDPVVAAASGRVIYIGTGIRGYGKLIVIKHDNNFNSVYAHNREILVKQDQAVARGQKIAELGDTDADSPKLHFEIRKSGKPVDPVKYLPPS